MFVLLFKLGAKLTAMMTVATHVLVHATSAKFNITMDYKTSTQKAPNNPLQYYKT